MYAYVKFWNVVKGFGFASSPNGQDYFLHISNWTGSGAPRMGEHIEFEIGPSTRGAHREQAVNARPAYTIDAGLDALRAAGAPKSEPQAGESGAQAAPPDEVQK